MVMGLMDFFNAPKIKKENERLNSVLEEINAQELLDVKELIVKANSELEEMKKDKQRKFEELQSLEIEIGKKKSEMIIVDEELLLQSFALYKPKYDFENSEEYKKRLDKIRQEQKDMVKDKNAATGNQNWTVNGKASEGKKMVNDMIKLVLRAFNNECDACIVNVKFNNIEQCEQRINKSFDALNNLGKIMQVNISPKYKKLKFDELYLAHEYKVKKQEEKEEQKLLREQMREEAKLQKEIDEARKTIAKEQSHYNNSLEKLKNQLMNAKTDEEKLAINEKIEETSAKLEEIGKNLKDIDYREANQRAGYVYIVSNVGSFGEDVYKIGMTRRLDPLDRINELGDASVPFGFDIHAMIFSDDAPGLEGELHKAFEDRKLNMINTRREFFKVSLDEIIQVVKENHDKTVEFVRLADAEEYRESLKIKEVR